MPASAANINVELQVVPPSFLDAIAGAISLLDSFTGSVLRLASRTSSVG